MSVKQAIRHRPQTRSPMFFASQENAEEKIHASFLSCSIKEEDILDNIEPNLVSATLTDSCSSHFSSDFRSYDDRFELSSVDPNNENDTLTTSHTRKPTNSPVDVLDDPIYSHELRSKLSLSMHDISKIPAFPLVSKQSNLSSETIQSQSITTVGSCPKSKDSGFPRSLSCLSLNSGKSYEHIQSKVKDYIKQIKAGNKAKKKLTYESATPSCKVGDTTYGVSTPPKVLLPIINKLQDELEEKDRMLLKLQENYDTLLMKYAAAENRIDHLRVNSVGNSFNITLPDYKKPKASPNMLLLPNLSHLQKESNGLETREKYKPEMSNQPTGTGPRPCFSNRNSTCLVDAVDDNEQLPFNLSTEIRDEKNGSCFIPQSHDSNWESAKHGIESHSVKNVANRQCTNKHQTTMPKSDNIQLSTQPLNHQLENPFAKVKRWQESLPSLHLIEPSIYDQFIGNDTGRPIERETFHNIQKDQTGWSQSESAGFMLTTNRNELPMDPKSPLLNNFPNSSAIDLDDRSCHTSQFKGTGTKDVCHNPNSVSTSLGSSSTFLCLENASNQSTSGQEPMRHIDSFSIQANNNIQIKNKLAPNYLPPISAPLLHNNHLPTLPKIQPIAKRLFSPAERMKNLLPFVHLDITKENEVSDNSLCRKRLLGQKARLLLMQYLNNSESPLIIKETKDSFEAKNVSLAQCLDEMNHCAQKLKGKSEAIMQVLAKQLKDS